MPWMAANESIDYADHEWSGAAGVINYRYVLLLVDNLWGGCPYWAYFMTD